MIDRRHLAVLLLVLSHSFLARADAPTLSPATRRMLEAADFSGDVFTLNDVQFAGAREPEVRAALSYYRGSLEGKRQRGDVEGEFRSLMATGILLHTLGENRDAIEPLQQAVALARKQGMRREEAAALHNLAVTHWALSEAETARGLYQQALTMLADPQEAASAHNNLGLASLAVGDRQTALRELEEALKLRRKLNERRGEAQTLNNLGLLFASLGEEERSLRYHAEALGLRRRIGDRHGEARSLNNLGALYMSRGDVAGAVAHYCEALPLFRETGNRVGEAACLNNLGVAHAARGDRTAALEYYRDALAMHRQVGDRDGEALTWFNHGVAHLDANDLDLAAASLEEALTISRSIADDGGEAAALDALARTERRRGDLGRATAIALEALDVVERARERIFSSELRATFLASRQSTYELAIDVLMDRGLVAEALGISERARVRGTIEAIAAAPLVASDAVLGETFSEQADRHAQLVAARNKNDAAQTLAGIDRLRDEMLLQERPLDSQTVIAAASEIQQQILDADSILLEYALGDSRSWLFVVTAKSIEAFELPPRAKIEADVRELYALLTARNARPRFETADERQARIAAADRKAEVTAARVAGVLIGRVKSAAKRILIVPDGVLSLLPFAALPASDAKLLIDEHEIVVLPSASALSGLRREAIGREQPPQVVAVIADPVFDAADPRVQAPRRSAAGALPRLPGSGQEAESIIALTPAGTSHKQTGFEATRAKVLSEPLGRYRYVHFATHTIIDSERPELSGIVLSLVDRKGRPQGGIVRAHDIAALDLPVEMVVLSGCGTALGKAVRGEGLVGLTQAFFRAGAERLVLSLWNVDDEGTAELMRALYRSMLGQPASTPATALREAQLALRKSTRWRAPYYWAAFVLNGEPN